MEFDLVTGIISVIIAATSAVTIYLIAEMSRKGPTYDDVKASQRQERNVQNTHVDPKADTKKMKKLKKKVKSSKPVINENSVSNEKLTNNLSDSRDDTTEETLPGLENYAATDSDVSHLTSSDECKSSVKTKVKNKNNKKQKEKLDATELLSPLKEELSEADSKPSLPLKNKNDGTNPENTVKPSDLNKEDADIGSLPTHSNKTDQPHDLLNSTSEPTEELMSAFGAPNKIKKKLKKKKNEEPNLIAKPKGAVAMSTLLPLLQQAELSHSELQILIDALLNKENDSEWYQGKQDPMLKVKKQLLEMEKIHSDDVDTITGLQAKLASMRSDLNNEKSFSKNLRDALNKAGADLVAISAKCQQSTDENQALGTQIQQLQQQISDAQVVIAKFEEEKVLQQQMHVSHDQHHEAVVTLQNQVTHLASQLQEQQNLNASLSAQLQEFRGLNTELEHMLNSSRFELSNINTQCASVSKEAEELHSKISELTTVIEALESNRDELKRNNEILEVEISKHNQEAKVQKSDPVEGNTDSSKNNGNLNFRGPEHSHCLSRLEEKETLLIHMNSELKQKDTVLEKLTNEVINCKNEANKKQTSIENLNVEITSLKNHNSKLSSELNAERIIVSELRAFVAEKSEEVTSLQQAIEAIRQKNNELRSKNWKVVEALSQAESSLKDVTSKLEESSKVDEKIIFFKNKIRLIIEALDPPSCLPDVQDDNSWFNAFEEIIKKLNSRQESHSTEELTSQNVKLQNLVVHYRSVINDLEVMLHNLEMKIQSEGDRQQLNREESNFSPEVDD